MIVFHFVRKSSYEHSSLFVTYFSYIFSGAHSSQNFAV